MYNVSMNMKSLFLASVIVLSIAGGLVYLSKSNGDDFTTTTPETKVSPANNSQSISQPSDSQTESNALAGAYVEYTDSIIADTSGTKLLFFHAPWCPQCRDLETDIEENEIPASVTIIKVDYDSNQALRQKYGVTIQTTIVRIDDEGDIVEKFVAYDDPSLESIKENLF